MCWFCKKDAPHSPLHCLFLFWCTALSLGRVCCRLNSWVIEFGCNCFSSFLLSICVQLLWVFPTVHCTKGTTCTTLFSPLFLFWCTALILVREGSASTINFPSMCSHYEKHKHNPFSLIWWKDHYEIAWWCLHYTAPNSTHFPIGEGWKCHLHEIFAQNSVLFFSVLSWSSLAKTEI